MGNFEVINRFLEVETGKQSRYLKACNVFADGYTLDGELEGNAVYSYGEHYPIIIHDTRLNIYILNSSGYSKSTGRHVSCARQALQSHKIKHFTWQYKDNLQTTLEREQSAYADNLLKSRTARQRKDWYIHFAKHHAQNCIDIQRLIKKLDKLNIKKSEGLPA